MFLLEFYYHFVSHKNPVRYALVNSIRIKQVRCDEKLCLFPSLYPENSNGKIILFNKKRSGNRIARDRKTIERQRITYKSFKTLSLQILKRSLNVAHSDYNCWNCFHHSGEFFH